MSETSLFWLILILGFLAGAILLKIVEGAKETALAKRNAHPNQACAECRARREQPSGRLGKPRSAFGEEPQDG